MNSQEIKSVLTNNGTTFAHINYETEIKTAAKYKHIKISKRTDANVTLFQHIKDFDIYRKSIIRSANTIEENGEVKDFEVSETWYTHEDTNCYSIITSKKTGEEYLYFICNNAKSEYYIDGELVDKDSIRPYLTASAEKEMFENDGIVYNKKNDVYHTIQPRTLKLNNISSLKANGSLI